MFDRESIAVFLNKVPDLRNGWRAGEEHRAYVRSTAALVPVKRLPGFLKLLVSFKR
jgi:hypothetical protein